MKPVVDEITQPMVVTKPTHDIEGLWISYFGDSVVINYPDESKVRKAWEVFGGILGAAKAVKIQYQTAGLKESTKRLEKELKDKEVELEERTLEIIGYPKLKEYVLTNLQSEAGKIGKFLNQYSIESYPHLPPQACVEAMQKAKPFFDTFEIWAVENKKIDPQKQSEAVKFERAFKDPVIIGCKKIHRDTGWPIDSIDRYFIASWGDDIPLEQVLGNPQQLPTHPQPGKGEEV